MPKCPVRVVLKPSIVRLQLDIVGFTVFTLIPATFPDPVAVNLASTAFISKAMKRQRCKILSFHGLKF